MPKKSVKVHFSGGVQTARAQYLPGWPCCCSGERAEKIEREGYHTTDPQSVTCAGCKRVMAKQVNQKNESEKE